MVPLVPREEAGRGTGPGGGLQAPGGHAGAHGRGAATCLPGVPAAGHHQAQRPSCLCPTGLACRCVPGAALRCSAVQDPVRAAPRDVDMEEYLIKDVGHKACPLHLTLERIVATPSGTVLACWQVRSSAGSRGGPCLCGSCLLGPRKVPRKRPGRLPGLSAPQPACGTLPWDIACPASRLAPASHSCLPDAVGVLPLAACRRS